jgi:hypothetical protein
MSIARYAVRRHVFPGFVLGAEGRKLTSAECYDPTTRRWIALPDLNVARYACGVSPDTPHGGRTGVRRMHAPLMRIGSFFAPFGDPFGYDSFGDDPFGVDPEMESA